MNIEEKLMEVLDGLVNRNPPVDGEFGGCIYCGGSGSKLCREQLFGTCVPDADCHQHDCEWLAARKLFDELKKD